MRSSSVLLLATTGMMSTLAVAQVGQLPNHQALMRAKQNVAQIQYAINSVIERVSGGIPSATTSINCSAIRSVSLCVESTRGQCTWNRHTNRCVPRGAFLGTEENDVPANFALLELQKVAFHLGEEMDEAQQLSESSQQYVWKIEKICFTTKGLIKGAYGGRISAKLPVVGLIAPSDFDEIISEGEKARNELFCY